MTEGNPVRGPLGALDPGQPGRLDHAPLGKVAGKNPGEDFGREMDPGLSFSGPPGHGLPAHIHHAGATPGVEMGEFGGIAHNKRGSRGDFSP